MMGEGLGWSVFFCLLGAENGGWENGPDGFIA